MTDRPSSAVTLMRLVARSTLTPNEVQSAALDVLQMVMHILDADAELIARYPNGDQIKFNVHIPGMTNGGSK